MMEKRDVVILFAMDPDLAELVDDPVSIPRQRVILIALAGLALVAIGLSSLFVSQASVSDPTSSSPEATFSEVKEVIVDVGGAVHKPGVVHVRVKFGEEARVTDVIALAGGLRDDVSTTFVEKSLNQAGFLADGAKLYIPFAGEESTSINPGQESGKINVNTAPAKELETLKGIGSSRAQAIIDSRPISSLEDLEEKAKLPQSVVETIQHEITF